MNVRCTTTYAVIVALAAIAAPVSAAQAQEGETIPAWIKRVFAFYVDGQITDAELITALEYLISQDIIQVTANVGQTINGQPATELEQAAAGRAETSEHEHASILVVIFGDRFDFSGPSFQMQNNWIRFEAQDGTTIHRHLSDVTIGFLFATLDIWIDEDCYIFPDGRKFCTNDDFMLRYYVNGDQVDAINDYVFDDQDRILITYGNEGLEQINEYMAELNTQPIGD